MSESRVDVIHQVCELENDILIAEFPEAEIKRDHFQHGTQ